MTDKKNDTVIPEVIVISKGTTIFLDPFTRKKKALVNEFIEDENTIVEMVEYNNSYLHGLTSKMFICKNNNTESYTVFKHTWNTDTDRKDEEYITLDHISFKVLQYLFNNTMKAYISTYVSTVS